MNEARTLLDKLSALDIELRADGGRLHIDAPRGALQPMVVDEIRAHKPALLRLLESDATGPVRLPRDGDRAELPLSLAQHAFYMLEQISPNNAAYDLFSARRIRAPLDPDVFATAFELVLERHEILRTSFPFTGARPVQRIEPLRASPLSLLDLTPLSADDRQRELERVLSRARSPRFELERGPLLRAELARCGDRDWLFAMALHHIVTDAASLDIFYRELLENYRALARGERPAHAPLQLQYGDFAAWQHARLESGQLDEQIAFWKRRLSDLPDLRAALGARPERASDACQTLHVSVPPGLSEQVRGLSRSANVSPFAVLVGAFQVLLARHTGCRDIPVITPVAGRSRPATRPLIGLFVSGVVLRCQVEPSATPRELLARIQADTADALSNQDISLEILEGILRRQRDRSVPLDRLARIAFNYIALPASPPRDAADLAVEPVELDRQRAVLDLMAVATDGPGGLSIKLEARRGLFPDDLLQSLAAQYPVALAAMCRTPDAALGQLQLVDEAQQRRALGAAGERVESVRVLDDRQRALWDRLTLPGRRGAGVLACSAPIAAGVDRGAVCAAVVELEVREPVLRQRLHRPASPLLGDCVAVVEASDPDAAAARVVAVAAETDDALHELTTGLEDPLASRPWRVAVTGGQTPRLWLAANELLLDPARAGALAERLASAAGGEAPASSGAEAGAAEPAPEAADDAAAGAAQPAPEDADDAAPPAFELTPLLGLAHRGAPPRLATRRARANGAQLAMMQRYCRRRGIDAVELVQASLGAVLASVAGPAGGFALTRYAHGRFVGFVAFPAGLVDGQQDLAALFDDTRALSPRAAQRLAYDRRWPADELEVVLAAWERPEQVPHIRPPRGQLRIDLTCAAEHLELRLAWWEDELADAQLGARALHVCEQIAAGAATARDLDPVLPGELPPPPAAPIDDTEASLHELVDAAARQHPDAIAVACGDERLTYRELVSQASRLATALREAGAFEGGVIGINLARSERLPVVLLAVLRCGCAYLPIDRRYPRDRVAAMLARAGASLVVTDASDSLPPEAVALSVDALWERARAAPPAASASRAPADPAYIIFTSGSTGEPKGVVVGHGAVTSFLRGAARRPGIDARDVLLAVTTIAFDISVLELFLPLSVGARVAIAGDAAALDGRRLIDGLTHHGATIMQATPHTWRMLLDAGWAGAPHLRALCGGEALSPQLAAALTPRVATLWNLYGPTEATVWATAARIEAGDDPIAIGTPLDAARVVLLDRAGRRVPPGCAGEIHIGGPQLALGYAGDPAQTAERFITWSPPGGPRARLYRTGDRGRLRADGALLFEGRRDRQVKLRGHRLELGEVEAAVRRLAGVTEVVAVIGDRGGGDARLELHVQREGNCPSERELRDALAQQLPAYAMPQRVHFPAALPRLANGKVDHARVASPAPAAASATVAARTDVESRLVEIWAGALGDRAFGVRDNFFEVGGHSLLMLQIHRRIEEDLGVSLEVVDLFRHPTIESLAAHLEQRGPRVATPRRPHAPEAAARDGVAIIGMAGAFPGAPDLDALWRNLARGAHAIEELDAEKLAQAGVPRHWLSDDSYVRAAAVLPDADQFDAGLFDLTPREAALLDPQHRRLLQCAYAALEDAACEPLGYPGRIGLFAGVGFSYYLLDAVLARPDALAKTSPLDLLYANDKDYAATRIAYKLNLRGPCATVGTACSTGLVAVHQACQSLRAGECEVALAGAARIAVPQRRGYRYVQGSILSPDGRCRPFDARANGTIFGNGVGVVVLKPLAAAVRDGDAVYAVIKGSAVTNDGDAKVGYTAPSIRGQVHAIAGALTSAGVEPDTIQYVETHGTGTPLGDAIELAALSEAFGLAGRKRSVAIGSIKASIGHLDTAAGIAGLIKTALALHHGKVPASAYFERANPALALERTPFFVNRDTLEWPAGTGPRRAGVSSFGIGGTNAHVVLEQAPAASAAPEQRAPALLVWSGRTPDVVAQSARRLAHHLQAHPEQPLSDVAYTLQIGRRSLEHRAFAVADDRPGATAAIAAVASRPPASAGDETPALVFAFPGQGSAFPGMAAGLYEDEPRFRAAYRHGLELAGELLGRDLAAIALAPAGDPLARHLDETLYAQPILFALEHALAALWMAWGLTPDACIGHSLGEYAAATVAGALPFEDGVRLVVERARLMHGAPEGCTAVIFAVAGVVAELLAPGCEIAAVNAPAVTVVAGGALAVARTLDAARARGVRTRALRGDRGFHSALFDGAVAKLERASARAALTAPRIPYISSLTGGWVTEAQATRPEHWARQMREPVRFADGVRALSERAPLTALELGPGAVLTGLLRAQLPPGCVVVPALAPRGRSERDAHVALEALGRVWSRGHRVAWDALELRGISPRRVHAPSYPFATTSHRLIDDVDRTRGGALPGTRAPIERWVYEPTWVRRRREPQRGGRRPGGATIVHAPAGEPLAAAVARQLAARGEPVVIVHPGAGLRERAPGIFALDPADADQYARLLATVEARCGAVGRVLHLATTAPTPAHGSGATAGYRTLVQLSRALTLRAGGDDVLLVAVTAGAYRVLGDEALAPLHALAAGPVAVLPREVASLRCAHLDLDPRAPLPSGRAAAAIVAELDAGLPARTVAFRGGTRWERDHVERELSDAPWPLPERPLCLLTGGLGGVGFALARHLARTRAARLALLGRSAPDARTAARLEQLARDGGEAIYCRADVTDRDALAAAIDEAIDRWGAIDVAIHAAGIADGAMVALRDDGADDRVLAPKVAGALNLSSLLLERGAGRLVLCSSISAQLGEPGQLAYCAGNAFLDALAEANRERGLPTCAIAWDTWSDAGMARDAQVPDAHAAHREARLALGIRASEGAALLERIAAADLTQAIVSTWELAARLRRHDQEPAAASAPNAAAARDRGTAATMADRLAALWRDSFGADVGPEDDFFALGGSSLQAVHLAHAIRQTLAVELSPHALLQHPTIAQLSAHLGGASASDSPIVPLRDGDPALAPLVLVHPVGGELFAYRDLAAALRTAQPIIGIRARGPLGAGVGVPELAATYAEAVREFAADGPWFLAGSSFGGTVVYEMARQLAAAGQRVALAAMIDTPGSEQLEHALDTDREVLAYLAAHLPAEIGLSAPALAVVADAELLAYFVERAQVLGMPAEMSPTLLRRYLDVFQSNHRAMRAYRAGAYDGPIAYYRARERRPLYDPADPAAPWRCLATRLHVIDTPGNHWTLHASPHVEALARELDVQLDAAWRALSAFAPTTAACGASPSA